ncbi:RNA methyltransferase [Ammoniphilus sp. CFH 90114]|uniref:TrmH family RNA methyltransferase n=1 Tax=Ammoniphilus sp. CFH 90114 TaxID=2493665 RepID=UPI00100FC47E|nr:RNA methyltransferase [Ammoniphilus sp. CFH 90114]RXT04745.1 RNA methyltransferase [Ammoniphilus sp. CFH 90114]
MFVWETIQSVQNSKVKEWAKLNSKKGRDKEQLFLIEGLHLVEEALKSKAGIRTVLIMEGFHLQSKLEQSLQNSLATVYWITEPIAHKLSETENPQGIFAIVDIPVNQVDELIQDSPVLLLLDAIQDPGNLGTMIRTADAAGIQGVILGKGTVDVYNPKTIRSTMGSIFHLPIVQTDLNEICHELSERGFRILATSLEGAVPYDEALYDGPVAIVIGNEANGVSASILKQCDKFVKIPIYGQAESLNAAMAAGIIMYEAIRQRK